MVGREQRQRTWGQRGLLLVLLEELVRLGLERAVGVPERRLAALRSHANLEPVRIHLAGILQEGEERIVGGMSSVCAVLATNAATTPDPPLLLRTLEPRMPRARLL